jgi:hypothetical protein
MLLYVWRLCVVTTVMVPTWTHTAQPVDESYGHDANNETFYPYKSTYALALLPPSVLCSLPPARDE